jgi:WD40 repeat protein
MRNPISGCWNYREAPFSRFTFSPAPDTNPVWSPDGSKIAFVSNRDGVAAIYQRAASKYLLFFMQNPKTNFDVGVLPTSGERKITWVVQSEFVASDDGKLYAVDIRPTPSFEVSTPKFLFDMHANTNATRNSYAPSADGQRFLVNMILGSTSSGITVVLNWQAALTARENR